MVYCYVRSDTGELVDVCMSWEEREGMQEDDDHLYLHKDTNDPVDPDHPYGVRARRAWDQEAPGIGSASAWPMHSYALGVNPGQRKEAYEHSKEIGVPTQFDRKGDAVFRSRKHRKDYCNAAGYYDRDAGYGDAQPDNL